MRIIASPLRRIRDFDSRHHLDGPRPRLFSRNAFVKLDPFTYLITNRVNRIQRCHRVLKDHSDIATADSTHLLIAELQQIGTIKHDLSRGDSTGWRDQAHYRQAGYRPTASRLSDQRQGRPPNYIEAHIICCIYLSGPSEEFRTEVSDFEDVVAH